MEQLTKEQLIKLRALEAAVMALKGKIDQSRADEDHVIRYAKVFERYLNS